LARRSADVIVITSCASGAVDIEQHVRRDVGVRRKIMKLMHQDLFSVALA
jgi:hypothetical protein